MRKLLSSLRMMRPVRRRDRRGQSRTSAITPECLEQRLLLAAAIPAIQVDGQAPVVLPFVNGHQLLALADADSTRLFTTDGTQAGTLPIVDMPAVMSLPTDDFAILGTELYFAADGAEGVELWKTDGTLAGTALVKDISVGGDSSPAEFAVFGGEVWFAATTAASGRELWKSDGTPAGTVQVVDLVAGAGSSRPGKLVEFDGQFFLPRLRQMTFTEQMEQLPEHFW